MKAGEFLMSHFFIGVLLIVLGLSIIIKMIFGIDIPIFRTLLAGALIYAGVTMLLGTKSYTYKKYVNMGVACDEGNNTYSLFGCSRVIDLSYIKPTDTPVDVTINGAFSKIVVKIDPQTPIEAVVNAGFSNATLPDGNSISFGTYHYKGNGAAVIRIHANLAFSSFELAT